MRTRTLWLALAGAMVWAPVTQASAAQKKVRVVTTLPEYAWAAKAVGGDRVEARSICPPEQDSHFLSPRPSYAAMVAEADLFIDTGLDLELWAGALLRKAGNSKVVPGQPGYVSASQGVYMLEVPTSADRGQGDVHVFGNPHLHTSPVNMRQVTRNIAAGLARIDPESAAAYEAGAKAVVRDLDVRTFGAELVDALGGDLLARLAAKDKLHDFLAGRQYKGRPLSERLGGWLGRMAPLRGGRFIAYHKNWAYFLQLFGFSVAAYVEPKPGIPATAGHVAEVLQIIEREKIPMMLVVSYYPRSKVNAVAARAKIKAQVVPFHIGGAIKTYPELVDRWISAVEAGLRGTTGASGK